MRERRRARRRLGREGQSKSTACVACHGPNGNSANPEWPSLAGQHEQYIRKQLQAFKGGARKNPLMTPMAASLSDDDMADLGAYFASQKPAGLEADPGKLPLGQRIYRSGDPKSGIAGVRRVPRPDRRRQSAGGVSVAARSVREPTSPRSCVPIAPARARPIANKMMRNVASTMSDEQIDAVASYVQGLR